MIFPVSLFKGSYSRMFLVLCPNPIYILPSWTLPLIKVNAWGRAWRLVTQVNGISMLISQRYL